MWDGDKYGGLFVRVMGDRANVRAAGKMTHLHLSNERLCFASLIGKKSPKSTQ